MQIIIAYLSNFKADRQLVVDASASQPHCRLPIERLESIHTLNHKDDSNVFTTMPTDPVFNLHPLFYSEVPLSFLFLFFFFHRKIYNIVKFACKTLFQYIWCVIHTRTSWIYIRVASRKSRVYLINKYSIKKCKFTWFK